MAFSIETERLSLQLRGPRDASWNLELRGEHEGRTTPTLSEEEQHLATQQDQARAIGFGFLTITRRFEGDPIGYCGVLIGRCTFDEPELAYELLRRHRGQGYATEAATSVLRAAFATGRQRIWATVRTWNTPSYRVLTKIGFQPDHTMRDDQGHLIYMARDATSRGPLVE